MGAVSEAERKKHGGAKRTNDRYGDAGGCAAPGSEPAAILPPRKAPTKPPPRLEAIAHAAVGPARFRDAARVKLLILNQRIGTMVPTLGRNIDLLKSNALAAVKTFTAPKCGSTRAFGSGRPRGRKLYRRFRLARKLAPQACLEGVAPTTTESLDVDGILTAVMTKNCCQKSVVSHLSLRRQPP
jgi:hypothetical protein